MQPQELAKVEKRIMSVIVVDKLSCKVCRFIKSLTSLEVNLQRGFLFTWDILLPTPAACVEASNRDLITKEILRTNYMGKRRTKVAVFEVSFK